MKSLNQKTLIGTVGHVVLNEVNGSTKLRIRLVTNESIKLASGVQKETSTWHTIALWDKYAETMAPIIKKGMSLFVQGVDRCTVDENGREYWEVRADKTIILTPKPKEQNTEEANLENP